MNSHRSFIGIDWGSTSFRAYLINHAGEIIDQIRSADGVKAVADNRFEATLLSKVEHWLTPDSMLLLSGMITSRNGWLETPYLPCPFALTGLLDHSVNRQIYSNRLNIKIEALFLPGACTNDPADVIRGEELQLYGVARGPKEKNINQLVVLPGTHSKWALVNGGVLENFHTVATGELFDVLINQTLIGGLASSTSPDYEAFSHGIRTGYASTAIISQLFTARSGVLLNKLDASQVYSYLSGLLIGNEIKESLQMISANAPILIIGSESLATSYASAFDCLQIPAEIESREAAALGFQKLSTQINTL